MNIPSTSTIGHEIEDHFARRDENGKLFLTNTPQEDRYHGISKSFGARKLAHSQIGGGLRLNFGALLISVLYLIGLLDGQAETNRNLVHSWTFTDIGSPYNDNVSSSHDDLDSITNQLTNHSF